MTWQELKINAEHHNIEDDFVIDVVGEYSGSFGDIKRIGKRIESFPDGDYKEFQLFIGA